MTVDYVVHHSGKDECTADIKEGMLLDKHGCQNDAYSQQKCKQANRPVLFELLVVHDRKTDAERIVHMDARKQVCRCISGIETLAEHGTDIVVRKISRTQILAIWIDGGYNQKYGHACKKKRTQFIIIGFVM